MLVDEPQVDLYLLAHKGVIAGAVEDALKGLYAAKPDDPLGFLSAQLLRARDGPPGAAAACGAGLHVGAAAAGGLGNRVPRAALAGPKSTG